MMSLTVYHDKLDCQYLICAYYKEMIAKKNKLNFHGKLKRRGALPSKA